MVKLEISYVEDILEEALSYFARMVDELFSNLAQMLNENLFLQLDNREIASLILLALFFIFSTVKSNDRKGFFCSILNVIHAAIKVLLTFECRVYLVCAVLIICFADKFGAWDPLMLKDTTIMVFFVGIPLLYSSHKAKSGKQIIIILGKKISVGATVACCYINLWVLPLFGELLLQFSVLMLSFLIWVAKDDPKYAIAKSFFQMILVSIGFGIIFYVLYRILVEWDSVDWAIEFRTLAMEFWFPVFLLPLMYSVSWISEAKLTLLRLRQINNDFGLIKALTIIILLGPRLKVQKFFNGRWTCKANNQGNIIELCRFVSYYKRDLTRRVKAERGKAKKYKEGIGKPGCDDGGLCFDRRDFLENKKELERAANLLEYVLHRDGFLNNASFAIQENKIGIDSCAGYSLSEDGKMWIGWCTAPSTFTFSVLLRDSISGVKYYEGPLMVFDANDSNTIKHFSNKVNLPNWMHDEQINWGLVD